MPKSKKSSSKRKRSGSSSSGKNIKLLRGLGKTLLSSIVLALLACIGLYLINHGYIRFNYPSRINYPIQGVDVSHHQGVIDWKKLKKQDVNFAYIKVTEGKDFTDTKYEENRSNAMDNDIRVGAYHFYRFCTDGSSQAKHFIDKCGKSSDWNLPPVADVEFGGKCNSLKNTGDLVTELEVFIAALEKSFGCKPIIYCTQDMYERFIKDSKPLSACGLWIRDVYSKPKSDEENNAQWMFWQFAARGRLNGIKGNVDLNAFNGSKKDFELLCR